MTYEFSGFRLDSTVLQYDGAVVPLTPKAVDTLVLLVSRAPELVTKDEIMKAIWPDTFVVESSLARNISAIRKALEDRGGPGPYIETIPKRGYRFVAAVNAEGPPPVLEAPSPPAASRRWVGFAGAGLMLVAAGVWLMRPAPEPEPDPAALIGRYLLYKATPADAQRALDTFEQAVAAQPKSAAAHAGLAEALLLLPHLALEMDSPARAKQAAETAVNLDARLGAAHAALGAARMMVDMDFRGAGQSLNRALELEPRSITPMIYLPRLLSAEGRLDEALKVAQRATDLDPVSPLTGVQLGVVLYQQRKFDEAARQFRSVLDRERNYTLAHYYLGLTNGFLGRFEEALAHLDRSELHPGVLRTDRAWLSLLQGDRAPAEAVYQDLIEGVKRRDMAESAPILAAVMLGRMDEAFAAVEAALRDRAPEVFTLRCDPRLAPLRQDPRFRDVERRIGTGR
jgi:DNA-binding winged helix-turn-helix (wHTH) protein/tetratricopeptide (TPR) repeat protein